LTDAMRSASRRRPRATLLAAAALAAALAATPAAADDITLPFQVPDRANALRLVIDFERAAKAGDWPTAADKLQQLLDTPADHPVVIRAKGITPARYEGTGVVARRLFDGLPPEGRAAWETNSRTRAEELLARGLRLRREQDLRDTARRFPAPDVLRRAHDALAQLAIVRSDLTAAQFELQSLYDASDPADRPAVLARLAWATAQAGDAEAFARVRATAAPYAGASVSAGGAPETLSAFLDRIARTTLAAAAPSGGVRQFGGDAHGSGLSEPPPVPGEPQWSIANEFMEGDENDQDSPLLTYRERSRMGPVVPLVAHGRVLVNSGLSVLAADLPSGVTAWRHDGPQQHADWRDSFVSTHTVAVADGVVYAALAARSDAPDAQFDRHFMGYTIIYPMPHRVLYALDERTGDVVWSHETARLAPGREDASEISKECVSSPPLVVGDDVIVTAWTYEGIYDVRLVCYDRRTGRTRWRTSIVQGQQELNLFGRPVKELATGPISESGGRVFLGTGLGVAAAVERADGRIAWITAYDQSPLPKAFRWHETRDRDVSWWPSPVAAAGDTVVMAPVDSRSLVAFDAATGAARWTRADSEWRRTRRWFLGATGGRAFVLGAKVWAYDVATGESAWTAPGAGSLAAAQRESGETAGVALLTKERVYVPTEHALVALSTASGAIEATWPLQPMASGGAPVTGNLASGDGALLVYDRSHVAASYRFEDLRARLEARVAAAPDDPQVRLDAGAAYAAAGQLDAAIETLDAGMQCLSRAAPRVRERVEGPMRHALYAARAARARRLAADGQDVAAAAADLRAAVEVARDRDDVVAALFALAEAESSAGHTEEAERALRRVAKEFPDVATATREGDDAQAGALALLRLGEMAWRAGRPEEAVSVWLDLIEAHGTEAIGATDAATAVRERLAELAKTEPSLVRDAVRGRAKKAFEKAKAANDTAALDRASRIYPDPEFGTECALLAADNYLAANAPREAVGVLTSQLAGTVPAPYAARLRWKLAAAYRALGETARERSELRRLAADGAGELVEPGLTGADAAKRELAAERFKNVAGALPDPKPPLTLLWQAGGPDQLAAQPVRLSGVEPPALASRMVLVRAGVVDLVEVATGRPVWEQSLRVEVRAAAATPNAIVVVGTDSASRDRAVLVLALSLADGQTVWRQRIQGHYRASETTLGVLYVLCDEIVAPGMRASSSVTAVSLSTGEVLRSQDFPGSLKPQLTAAEDAIVVSEPARGRDGPRRSVVTLDGTLLTVRGRQELRTPSSPWCLHPPLSPVVVTSDGDDLVAVDVGRGTTAWTAGAGEGRNLKAAFAVAGGVIVSDDRDGIRRLDADTGHETWNVQLGSSGNLVYQGEAAEGDLVVATLKPPRSAEAVVVALDAATGAERWRAKLPLTDENTGPQPQILGSVVAYELNESLDRRYRSRLVLLDRANGAVLQEIEHPTIGRNYERVVYGRDWIAVSSANEVAVYGRVAGAK
jgi:outer membrane protein assembly factor BamB